MSSTYIKITVNRNAKVEECIKLCVDLSHLLKETGIVESVHMASDFKPDVNGIPAFMTIN